MVLPYLCSPSNKASWLGVVVSLLVAFLGKLHVFGKDNIGGGQSAQIFFFFLGWLFLGKKDTVVVAVEDFFGDLSFQAFGSAAALVAVVQQVPKGLSDTFAGRVVPNLEPLLSVLVKLDKATPGALTAHQPHHIRDDGRLLGAAAHAVGVPLQKDGDRYPESLVSNVVGGVTSLATHHIVDTGTEIHRKILHRLSMAGACGQSLEQSQLGWDDKGSCRRRRRHVQEGCVVESGRHVAAADT